jgi:hypothetical protein
MLLTFMEFLLTLQKKSIGTIYVTVLKTVKVRGHKTFLSILLLNMHGLDR